MSAGITEKSTLFAPLIQKQGKMSASHLKSSCHPGSATRPNPSQCFSVLRSLHTHTHTYTHTHTQAAFLQLTTAVATGQAGCVRMAFGESGRHQGRNVSTGVLASKLSTSAPNQWACAQDSRLKRRRMLALQTRTRPRTQIQASKQYR